jgi:hypothetical protein
MTHSKSRVVLAVLLALGAGTIAGTWSANGTPRASAQGVPPTVPAAAPAEPDRLTGTFVLAEPRNVAEERVSHAIDDTVSHLNIFIRSVGAGRLRRTNDVPEQVQIEIAGDRDVVSYDGDRYEGVDGVWRDVIARGDPTQLLMQRRGSRLDARFRTHDGEKLQSQIVSPDGRTLTLAVRVTSGQLPVPLEYRIQYRRR